MRRGLGRLVGFAAVLLVAGGAGAMVASALWDGDGQNSNPLCPPPPVVAGYINAVPLPITELNCALGAADIEIVTKWRRDNGSTLVRRHRTLVGIPTLVNTDDDLLADFIVWPQILGTDHFKLTIDKDLLELGSSKVMIDVIVNDPTGGSLPRDRIHGGYDARHNKSPKRYEADITLGSEPNGDTRVGVVANVTRAFTTQGLTILGGLFDGDSLHRQNPLGGTAHYQPIPTKSSITLGIGEQYRLALTTNQQTTLDAEIELVDGTTEQVATAHLKRLAPSTVVTYIPGATEDQRTINYAATAIVGEMNLTYRKHEAGTQTLGAVVNATEVPQLVGLNQTGEKSATLETDGAFGSLEVGMANGEPLLKSGATGPYVKVQSGGSQEPGGGWSFSSVAARIDGLKRASIDATDVIVADVEITPAGRKPVALEVDDPTLAIDGTVTSLPEHLNLTVDLDGPVITYDGHGQGLDAIDLIAHQTTPFFGRASDIKAHAGSLAPAFTFQLNQIRQVLINDVVVREGVEVTSTEPIGLVEFEATDGTGPALPEPYQAPATGTTHDTGAVYVETPSRYAVGARVHDFQKVHIDRFIDGTLTLGSTTAAEPFSLDVTLDDPAKLGDRVTADGIVTVLPHVLDLTLRTPTDAAPGFVDVVGSSGIDDISMTVDMQTPFLNRPGADPHIAAVQLKGIPAVLHADVEVDEDGASVVLANGVDIDMVEALITSGPTVDFPLFGEPSGIAARLTDAEFAVLGRLRNVREVRFAADPLEVGVRTTDTQPFLLDITLDNANDAIPTPGRIVGELAQLPTDLAITKFFNRVEWSSNGAVAGRNAFTLTVENLPSDDDGALNDGGVHFLQIEIDDLPEDFRINVGDTPIGIEALNGGSFGRIFVQVSDSPQALLADNDPSDPALQHNLVEIESADDVLGEDGTTVIDPGFLTAFLRVYDIRTANYYFYLDAQKTFDVVLSDPAPPRFIVDVDTTTVDLFARMPDPPPDFTISLDNTADTLVGWDASTETDLDVQFALVDAIAGDLEIDDIPEQADFCISTADLGCDSAFEADHPVDNGQFFYNIPTVFHTYLDTSGADGPITVNGLLCLKPKYTAPLTDPVTGDPLTPPPVWENPTCDFEGGPQDGDVSNSQHRVKFLDVQVTEFKVDLVSGRSFEPDDEDDLIGGYMDLPSFSGNIIYTANVVDEPETYDDESRVWFQSIGAEPFWANDWEFIIDTTSGSVPSQIFAAGDNDCGSDSKLEMWVATQYSDLFELDDLTPEVDLCTD